MEGSARFADSFRDVADPRAAVLMGMVMPLVLVWASSEAKKAVARVGRSYAINTVGAIAGAFVPGLF